VGLPCDEDTIEEMQNSMKKTKSFSAFKVWHFINRFGKDKLSSFLDNKEFSQYFS
jgi:hypothetical protein